MSYLSGAVVDPQLPDHLRTPSHRAEQHSKRLAEIQEYLAQFEDRYLQMRTPVPKIPLLKKEIRAYQYQYPDCGVVMEIIGRIQKHCRDDYQWQNLQRQGPPKKNAATYTSCRRNCVTSTFPTARAAPFERFDV